MRRPSIGMFSILFNYNQLWLINGHGDGIVQLLNWAAKNGNNNGQIA